MNPFLQNSFFPGVLSQGNGQAKQNSGVLTNNARQSVNPYIQQPEALARMGGAIMAGATQGGLTGLTAGVDAYGQMMDYNRSQANALAVEERERQRVQAMMNKTSQKEAEQKEKDQQEIQSLGVTLGQMQEAKNVLQSQNITGPFAGTVGNFFDRSGARGEAGVDRAYIRKLLQGFKVDDTLLRTAETKGAISDREMALFESPLPSMNEDEGVWIQYLDDRMDVIRKVLAFHGIDNENTGSVAPNQAQPPASVTDEELDGFLNPGN